MFLTRTLARVRRRHKIRRDVTRTLALAGRSTTRLGPPLRWEPTTVPELARLLDDAEGGR